MNISKWAGLLLAVLAVCHLQVASGMKLRMLKVQIADEPSAGMDGGNVFSFGEFRIKICSLLTDADATPQCCKTSSKLNTKDNNWERGEVNFFVGRQLHECENFELPMAGGPEVLQFTLEHRGTDGCKVQWVQLVPEDTGLQFIGPQYRCSIGVKLDLDQSFTSTCSITLDHNVPRDSVVCNGHTAFCSIPFNEFVFAGSHNSGTGQGFEGLFPFWYKNQDLNLVEQLDFGIRFFDFDVIISHNSVLGCQGLMTGHGFSSQMYQCYASVEESLAAMKTWLDLHPSEVIVLNFGDLKPHQEAATVARELKRVLRSVFAAAAAGRQGVGLNSLWQQEQKWPTLGRCVELNQRVFVFIMDQEPDGEFINALSVKEDQPAALRRPDSVSILSTFTAGTAGPDCLGLLETSGRICADPSLNSTLTKLAAFGSLTVSNPSLKAMARICNAQLMSVVHACLKNRPVVNFIQVDFPNYPGTGNLTVVDIAYDLNLRSIQSSR